jgi:hypothetical protein
MSRCIRRHHGGAVLCIEGRSPIERIQAASCERPLVRSPKPRFAATSRATARIKCAILGVPCIGRSVTRSSNKLAIRCARATSCAKTVGERSPAGLAVSRIHTQMPSHALIQIKIQQAPVPRRLGLSRSSTADQQDQNGDVDVNARVIAAMWKLGG